MAHSKDDWLHRPWCRWSLLISPGNDLGVGYDLLPRLCWCKWVTHTVFRMVWRPSLQLFGAWCDDKLLRVGPFKHMCNNLLNLQNLPNNLDIKCDQPQYKDKQINDDSTLLLASDLDGWVVGDYHTLWLLCTRLPHHLHCAADCWSYCPSNDLLYLLDGRRIKTTQLIRLYLSLRQQRLLHPQVQAQRGCPLNHRRAICNLTRFLDQLSRRVNRRDRIWKFIHPLMAQ